MKKIAFSSNESWALVIYVKCSLVMELMEYLSSKYDIYMTKGNDCVLIDDSPLLTDKDIDDIKYDATKWVEEKEG